MSVSSAALPLLRRLAFPSSLLPLVSFPRFPNPCRFLHVINSPQPRRFVCYFYPRLRPVESNFAAALGSGAAACADSRKEAILRSQIRVQQQQRRRRQQQQHRSMVVSAAAAPATNDAETERRAMAVVAVAQMTATGDMRANLETCSELVQKAKSRGVQLLSLPECFSFIGAREGESVAIAESLQGPTLQRYCDLARESGMWLSLGGFQEVAGEGRIYNAHVLVDDSGHIASVYRKIHLFDVDVPGGPRLKESNSTAPGSDLVCVTTPVGRLGLTVCYDLRFPEVYQRLRFDHGAEILLVPSAFTVKTGEAHWEVLLRARAIECQCYVLAAAQAGRHNYRRESYGHALIIDPWGTVVARCDDSQATDIAVARIDEELLASIRQRMPIASHRREDVYCKRQAPASTANEREAAEGNDGMGQPTTTTTTTDDPAAHNDRSRSSL